MTPSVKRLEHPPCGSRNSPLVLAMALATSIGVFQGCAPPSHKTVEQVTTKPPFTVDSAIRWVAYAPPSGNPNRGIEATPEAIREDLELLHRAKFTGLVTYGCSGVMGRELPRIAQNAGFKGIIVGIWSPNSQQEIATAVAGAGDPMVLGYCVGNEGLGQRYSLEQLGPVIQNLRDSTGKPVTTAEQYGDYTDERLLKLGDWVFPTVHPYFYHIREPLAAARWTKAAYDDLRRRSGRFVLLKEVGLPTAGDEEGRMSEAAQEKYYTELAKTNVRFVYFEGFDQPWKTHLPIEPHWGFFTADRMPKLFARGLLKDTMPAGQEK
jgi:exo-beta-1,3-glucanase (GH17 family)